MRRIGGEIALALAIAVTTAALTAPGAAGQAGPWRDSCVPVWPGVTRTSSSCGATLVDGRAIPPPHAPAPVTAAIEAANRIVHKPYVWGGGHTSWWTRGYDCSGAVGYALHGAGLLDATMVSGQLELWGLGGVGRWISVYANHRHVYMVIAGLRFDTRDDPLGVTGPRWHTDMVNPRKFVARHPIGI